MFLANLLVWAGRHDDRTDGVAPNAHRRHVCHERHSQVPVPRLGQDPPRLGHERLLMKTAPVDLGLHILSRGCAGGGVSAVSTIAGEEQL